jgi:glycerol-3-phosphate dehydrogenase (NAD(P)+)
MNTFFKRENLRYAVIGSGSWATALVKLVLNNQSKVSWYVRDNEVIDYIKERGHNPYYLPAIDFDTRRLSMSADINEIVENSDVIIFCIPSAYFLKEMERLTASLEGKFVISAVKGIISDENITIAEYFHKKHHLPFGRIGVISGPSHAEEIAMERLTYLTLTSKYPEVAGDLCKILDCKYVKSIPGTDIYGVEFAAVLKNIYAIGAGICHSLSYGDNFMAVFITNCFNEMREFLHASHPETSRVTSTSAYLGDLLVTCYSQYSRNRTFGTMIGKGISIQAAQLEMNMVAEGFTGAKAIFELNKRYNINMPIARAVYEILYEHGNPATIIKTIADNLQ